MNSKRFNLYNSHNKYLLNIKFIIKTIILHFKVFLLALNIIQKILKIHEENRFKRHLVVFNKTKQELEKTPYNSDPTNNITGIECVTNKRNSMTGLGLNKPVKRYSYLRRPAYSEYHSYDKTSNLDVVRAQSYAG